MAEATKRKRSMSEDARNKKEESGRARNKTRVNIGPAFSRWRELMEKEGCKSDAEMAMLLIEIEADSLLGGWRWNDMNDPDITPRQPTFRPTRLPGPQFEFPATSTALQLFQLFFTDSVLQTIVNNTNDFCSTHTTLTLEDMYSFMALVIYMGVVKCAGLRDYWRMGKLYELPFPRRIMTFRRFVSISRSLHLSSSAQDAANEEKRGTAAFDRLCKIKPLYEEVRSACRRNYHPAQEVSIGERMVASKPRNGLKQFIKSKPTRCRHKLFVLTDSSSGYTWDFFVSEGKLEGTSGNGLGYESVMELINAEMLGTGYKLFVDNFYTSPTLFHDLLKRNIWACGTIRANRPGFPKTKFNSLDAESPRGSIRWIRKDSLLFVQWRDTGDFSLCSTLHTAHSKDTMPRRVKGANGQWTSEDIPVPPAVKEYNQFIGGVDPSDALTGDSKALHKTYTWYKRFFYQFMDIAIVNAFVLYKDIAISKGEKLITQKAFRETLAEQLAKVGSVSLVKTVPNPAPWAAHHRPVYISGHSTTGRQKCRQCLLKTPLKCPSCDVPLCFVPGRDCYNDWHVAKKM